MAKKQSGSYQLLKISENIHRLWFDPRQNWLRGEDPTLGQWANSCVSQGVATLHENVESALEEAGWPFSHDLAFSIDESGTVEITGTLAPGESIYGAYDADAKMLNRRGDHVHLITEIHPRGRHLMLDAPCSICAESHDGELSKESASGLSAVEGSSNYGELALPSIISSQGFALHYGDLVHGAIIDLGDSHSDRWSISAPSGHACLYLIHPDTPLMSNAVSLLYRLLGRPAMPPVWSLGYLQSRFGYESFDHAISMLEEAKKRDVPIHATVFDVQWLEQMVNLRWNPDSFPSPDDNVAKIKQLGSRVIVITEPGTRIDSDNYGDLKRSGALIADREGNPIDSGQWYSARNIDGFNGGPCVEGGLVDFYREDAIDKWYERHHELRAGGVDAWWLDLNEPEDVLAASMRADSNWPELPGDALRNTYALSQQRGFFKREIANFDDRVFMLTRSGASGLQRYGAAPWSGDVGSTWTDLKNQPRLALTAGLCGVPLWGSDCGGFFGDPGPELFVRWMQAGAFMPVFRAHGYMADREPWSQGEDAFAAIRDSLLLRAMMLPSIATWMHRACTEGIPLMRPMWWGNEDRKEEWTNCEDQWYFGSLIVAPVLEEGVDSRKVRLPRGEWVSLWDSAQEHEGGSEIRVDVDLNSVPVFVPKNTLLVVDPKPTGNRAFNWPPPDLDVWSWSDKASSSLYIDDGLTREYEQGSYALIDLSRAEGRFESRRVRGSFPIPSLRLVEIDGQTPIYGHKPDLMRSVT